MWQPSLWLKRCSTCRQEKPYADYGPLKTALDGQRGCCRLCQNASIRAWRNRNKPRISEYNRRRNLRLGPERIREQNRAWYEQNRVRANQAAREYRRQHPEQMRGYLLHWRANNQERIKVLAKRFHASHPGYSLKYTRARQLRERTATLDKTAVFPIYDEAAQLTVTTGIRYEIDHIVPITHPLVCGLHVPANLQILSAAENRRKGNRFTPLVIIDPRHPWLQTLQAGQLPLWLQSA